VVLGVIRRFWPDVNTQTQIRLSALGVRQGCCDGDLDAELIGPVRLALDTLHFWRVRRADLRSALALHLIAHPSASGRKSPKTMS
jgi:hypothetical protein